jgi:tetratricopeptide (TPR) repeat protein
MSTIRRLGFFSLVIMLAVLPGRISSAHVDADAMPDSVAEVEYRIFLEFRPNDVVVRNKLGMVLYRRDKLKDAAREFARVLKLAPDNFDALDAMGLVKVAQREYDQAIRYFRAALAVNADDLMVHYHLGIALEKKGRLSEAAASYQTALDRLEQLQPPGAEDENSARVAAAIKAAINNILETRD